MKHMKRARLFLFLGVWVALLPYLGFPRSIKNMFFVLTGLVLAYIGYVVYRESKRRIGKLDKKTFENFSENQGFSIDNE